MYEVLSGSLDEKLKECATLEEAREFAQRQINEGGI